jgi:hypothetical protein
MTELGELHDAALHAPYEPPADWGERAWQLSDVITARARRAGTRRRRLRAALDRRPLAATAIVPDPPVVERPVARPCPPAATDADLTERSPERPLVGAGRTADPAGASR